MTLSSIATPEATRVCTRNTGLPEWRSLCAPFDLAAPPPPPPRPPRATPSTSVWGAERSFEDWALAGKGENAATVPRAKAQRTERRGRAPAMFMTALLEGDDRPLALSRTARDRGPAAMQRHRVEHELDILGVVEEAVG